MYFREIPKDLEVRLIKPGSNILDWIDDPTNKSWSIYRNLLDSISNDDKMMFRFNPVSRKDSNRSMKLRCIDYYHIKNSYKKETPIETHVISNTGFKLRIHLSRHTNRAYCGRVVIELRNKDTEKLNLGYALWVDVSFSHFRELLCWGGGTLGEYSEIPGNYKLVIGKVGSYPDYYFIREEDENYSISAEDYYAIRLGDLRSTATRTRDLQIGHLYQTKNRCNTYLCLGYLKDIEIVQFQWRYYNIPAFPIAKLVGELRGIGSKITTGQLPYAPIVLEINDSSVFTLVTKLFKSSSAGKITLKSFLTSIVNNVGDKDIILARILSNNEIKAINSKDHRALFYDFGKIVDFEDPVDSIITEITEFFKEGFLKATKLDLEKAIVKVFPEFKDIDKARYIRAADVIFLESNRDTFYRILTKKPDLTAETLFSDLTSKKDIVEILNGYGYSNPSGYNYEFTTKSKAFIELREKILLKKEIPLFGKILEEKDWLKLFSAGLKLYGND